MDRSATRIQPPPPPPPRRQPPPMPTLIPCAASIPPPPPPPPLPLPRKSGPSTPLVTTMPPPKPPGPWFRPTTLARTYVPHFNRFNEKPNPNPNPKPLVDPSPSFCAVDEIPVMNGTSPSFGASSNPKGVSQENTLNYWPREHNNSLSRTLHYGYGCSGWLSGPCPPVFAENPFDIPKTPVHVENGTIACNISEASTRVENWTTPYNISKAPDHIQKVGTHSISKASNHVENAAMPHNISVTSSWVPSALLNPMPFPQPSDTVLARNSDLKFSSELPHENASAFDSCHGYMFPSPSRKGISSRRQRVLSYPHKGTYSDICKEEEKEVRNDKKREMEAKNPIVQLEQFENAKQFTATDGTEVQHSLSCCPHVTGASFVGDTVGATGSSVLSAEDAPLNVILEALRYLSGVLLSSDFDASELKDHDHKLLQLVVDNIGAFTIKNKKDVTSTSAYDSGLKDAHSSIAGLKSDFVIKQNNGSHEMEEKRHSVASDKSKDELDFANHHNCLPDLNNDENVVQAVEKTFQNNFSNNEESFNAQVYKKLWIDAEAALCSLKYELKLAQMKIDVENHNHQTTGESQQSSKVSSRNSMNDHDEHETTLMAKEKNPLAASSTAKDKVVVSVMTGLKVSIDQDDIANSTSTANLSDTQLRGLVTNGPEINTKTGKGDEEIEAPERMKVLAPDLQSSTDGELETKPTSGDEGSSFSSEWEHVTSFELL